MMVNGMVVVMMLMVTAVVVLMVTTAATTTVTHIMMMISGRNDQDVVATIYDRFRFDSQCMSSKWRLGTSLEPGRTRTCLSRCSAKKARRPRPSSSAGNHGDCAVTHAFHVTSHAQGKRPLCECHRLVLFESCRCDNTVVVQWSCWLFSSLSRTPLPIYVAR